MFGRNVGRLRDRLDSVGVDAGRACEAIMVAQGLAGIFFAKQPALSQDRHHLFSENVEPAGQPGRHDVEAVGGTVLEPGLDVVRDLFRRSGNLPR